MLSLEQAKQKAVDTINLMRNAESCDVWHFIDRYAAIRRLSESDKEEVYDEIVTSIFGN